MKRRALDFRDFEALLDDVDSLSKHGYDQVGDWDLAQICHHVALPINQCIDGFAFKAPWLLRLLGPPLMRRIFRQRRIKAGLKAPGPMIPPAGLDQAKAIDGLRQAVGRLRDHAGPYQRHPLGGELSPQQWHDFHLIHAAHHLSFLRSKQ